MRSISCLKIYGDLVIKAAPCPVCVYMVHIYTVVFGIMTSYSSVGSNQLYGGICFLRV
jgi:predicted transporter